MLKRPFRTTLLLSVLLHLALLLALLQREVREDILHQAVTAEPAPVSAVTLRIALSAPVPVPPAPPTVKPLPVVVTAVAPKTAAITQPPAVAKVITAPPSIDKSFSRQIAETPPKSQPEPEPEPEPEPSPQSEPTPAAEPDAFVTPPLIAQLTPPLAMPVADTRFETRQAATEIAAQQLMEQARIRQHYLQTLVAKINRHKFYPQHARRRKQEGVITLRFVLNTAGQANNIVVEHSSGYQSLDRAALQTLHRALPLEPIPPQLAQSEWLISVPIRYALRDS